jgi:acetolactate synthase-1/2/3 large subunit
VVAVGYDLVEFSPSRWNPNLDKRIIHIHRTVAEVDAAYTLEVGIQSSIGEALDAIAESSTTHDFPGEASERRLVAEELERGALDGSFPLKPQRIVSDIRAAMGREDIVLCDTGASKIWMARLYPTYEPNTCLISNGLATMAFSLPGAFAAKLVHPQRRVLASMGDGAFLMSVAEIETAVREGVNFTVLVWVDGGYGLIRWKEEIHLGRTSAVSFGNPDFVTLAESFGARGYSIEAAGELGPTLDRALADDAVSIIACPVDYSAADPPEPP